MCYGKIIQTSVSVLLILLFDIYISMHSLSYVQSSSSVVAGTPPVHVLHQHEEAAGVTDELVQEAEDVVEARPPAALLLPAVNHQLVQSHRAAHGRRQPVALLYGQDHLQRGHTVDIYTPSYPGAGLSILLTKCWN